MVWALHRARNLYSGSNQRVPTKIKYLHKKNYTAPFSSHPSGLCFVSSTAPAPAVAPYSRHHNSSRDSSALRRRPRQALPICSSVPSRPQSLELIRPINFCLRRSPSIATVLRAHRHRSVASPPMRASGQPTPESTATAGASRRMTYQCSPIDVNTTSSTSRTHSLDMKSAFECGQLSRKQVKGNSSNHTARSIGMPGRAPFQDITNVVDSHTSSKGIQAQKFLGSVDHPITDASERKRYHDRERYLRMTPEQRAAYLQRNREYKQRRKNPGAVSDNVQSGNQIGTCTNLSMQTTTLSSTSTKGTDQHKRIAAFMDKGSGHKRMRISTSCNESTSTGQHKRITAFMDKGSEHKRRRMSNWANCSSTGKEAHEHVVANEQEDNDITIYVPNGYFPALEDESEQSQCMMEDDDEDDESYIFTGHGTDCISSYRDPNYANCEVQDDPFDRIYQNVPSGHHVLDPVPNCTHCNAKRFQYENPTFCCMGGKVKIITPHVPAELRRLYTSQDHDAKYFQDNIRVNWNHMPLWIMNLK